MRPRFEDLLKQHEKEIYRFVLRMTGNREDASDVLQETFMRAFRSLGKLPPDANHRAWLYRVATRLALNLARAKRVRQALPIEDALHLEERNGDLESLVETRRLARVLGDAIRGLSSRQRVALLQRKYEGLSYREIAFTLGCTEETARAHVYQAMEKIRRGLSPSSTRSRRGRAIVRRSG
ncbi:MAG: RNA polymerase sigma factor [Acidobacteriota bacterium]